MDNESPPGRPIFFPVLYTHARVGSQQRPMRGTGFRSALRRRFRWLGTLPGDSQLVHPGQPVCGRELGGLVMQLQLTSTSSRQSLLNPKAL